MYLSMFHLDMAEATTETFNMDTWEFHQWSSHKSKLLPDLQLLILTLQEEYFLPPPNFVDNLSQLSIPLMNPKYLIVSIQKSKKKKWRKDIHNETMRREKSIISNS